MDDTPDYQLYSLKQLYDVAQHINTEKFPDRFALVMEQIFIKEAEAREELEVEQSVSKQEHDERKSPFAEDAKQMLAGCSRAFSGASIGTVLGILIAIIWLNIFQLKHVPNMDGMNQWGGHVGLIMMGIFFGSICGAVVGLRWRR